MGHTNLGIARRVLTSNPLGFDTPERRCGGSSITQPTRMSNFSKYPVVADFSIMQLAGPAHYHGIQRHNELGVTVVGVVKKPVHGSIRTGDATRRCSWL